MPAHRLKSGLQKVQQGDDGLHVLAIKLNIFVLNATHITFIQWREQLFIEVWWDVDEQVDCVTTNMQTKETSQ